MTPDYATLPDELAEAEIYTEFQAYDSDSRLKYTQIGPLAWLWRWISGCSGSTA